MTMHHQEAGRLRPVVAGLLLIGLPVGCEASEAETWSTRGQSVLAADFPQQDLNLDEREPVILEGRALREAAIDVLYQASESSNALLRAHAIEALQQAPEHIEPIVQRSLADENRGVRFIAAMTVGQLRLKRLAHLLEPLVHDESGSVQAAAIFGLHANELPVDLNPLADLLMRDDPEVRANTAMVLGAMGDSSATAMLRQALHTPIPRISESQARIVELQLAEAMARLGADDQLDAIRAALFAPVEQGEIIILACQIIGRLEDRAYTASLRDLALREGRRRQPPEIRMAAAAALSQLVPDRPFVEVPGEYVTDNRYALRAQAAVTLGFMDDPQALTHLKGLITDPNPIVQVSAAGSILRIQER